MQHETARRTHDVVELLPSSGALSPCMLYLVIQVMALICHVITAFVIILALFEVDLLLTHMQVQYACHVMSWRDVTLMCCDAVAADMMLT